MSTTAKPPRCRSAFGVFNRHNWDRDAAPVSCGRCRKQRNTKAKPLRRGSR